MVVIKDSRELVPRTHVSRRRGTVRGKGLTIDASRNGAEDKD